MSTKQKKDKPTRTGEPTKLVWPASLISGTKMTKVHRKREELDTSSTKTPIGTRKHQSERRISMSPVAQKPRQISDIARAHQAKHLTTKLARNGRKNLKQRMAFLSVHGAYKMIRNTDSTHD